MITNKLLQITEWLIENNEIISYESSKSISVGILSSLGNNLMVMIINLYHLLKLISFLDQIGFIKFFEQKARFFIIRCCSLNKFSIVL